MTTARWKIFSGRLVSIGETVERGLVARAPSRRGASRQEALSAQRSAARGSLPAQVADHWATLSDLRAGVERFLRVRRDRSATP